MLRHLRKAVTSPVNKRWTKPSPQASVSLFIRCRPHATLPLPSLKLLAGTMDCRVYEGCAINLVSLMLEVGRCWDEETFVAGFLSTLYRLLQMMMCFFSSLLSCQCPCFFWQLARMYFSVYKRTNMPTLYLAGGCC